jgi:pre-rRNA-processing protein IPI3
LSLSLWEPFAAVSAQVSKNALDVWGLDKESALHKFFVGEPMGTIAASPDGHFFAAGSLTGAAYIWEVPTGRLVRTWPAHFKAVSAMCFAAQGSVLVTGGEDTVVSAWSLASLLDPAAGGGGAAPAPMYSWAEHSLPVTALACGGGGGGGGGGAAVLVASASADRTCKLWTLGGGHLLRTIALPAALGAVALDACEATLYAGAVDGRVFEVPLNAAPPAAAGGGGTMAGAGAGAGAAASAVLEGHVRAITALACTADGERVVSSSEDGTCRVWDAASRQTTHILRHPKAAPFTAIAMAPRARVAGDGSGGGGGGGEKRKLAPLAPFSRFASGGGGGAGGAGGSGSGGGRGGKLQPWEGAPLVLRGCGAEAAGGALGGGGGLGSGLTAAPRVTTFGGGGGGAGGGSLGKRARGEGGEAGAAGGGGGGGGGDEAEEDVGALKRRLAAAEASAAAAKEEVASWKQKHGELRAFVAEELVTRETHK